jgi:uncharacterized tellurite resistance protein B-like protein
MRDEAARQALLQEIEEYFASPAAAAPDASHGDRELRVATAVLLLELVRADHEVRHDEHRAVTRALERVLQATPEQSAAIVRLAEEQLKSQRPLHGYAREIDRRFKPEEKRRLIAGLWRVAFADAEILAHEEYLIRKIADLLHVPKADFLGAKIEAKEAFFGEDA